MKKFKIRPSVPVDEILSYMNRWSSKSNNRVKVNKIGETSGFPIYNAVFTDERISDEDKQRVLIIAQHSGMEISGMTTVMSLGNYLASDAPEVQSMMKKLIVVLVPCPNPFSYSKQDEAYQFRNENGIDEYISFDYDGARNDGKAMSAVAIQNMIDKYKPEMLIDCHGIIYDRQLVMESCGISAFAANRMFRNKVVQRIQNAAEKEGFAIYDDDFLENNILADTSVDNKDIIGKFRQTAKGAVAPIYAYLKYHTLAASIEVSWEESGFNILKEALNIGCQRYECEHFEGYPVRNIMDYGTHSLRAWGKTAHQRRISRQELWSKRDKILMGIGYPDMPELSVVFISCSPKLAQKYIKKYYTPIKEVFERMRDEKDVNADELIKIMEDGYDLKAAVSIECGEETIINNGMTIRVGIPFKSAKIEKVLYNGFELSIDEMYGYMECKDRNWTFVDVNIEPDKVALFGVVAVKYKCDIPKTGIIEF